MGARRTVPLSWALLGACAAASGQPAPGVPTADTLVANWGRLEALDESTKSYRAKSREMYKEAGETTVTELEFFVRRQPGYRLVRSDPPTSSLVARSPAYEFWIARPKPGSPWLLKGLTKADDMKSLPERDRGGMSLYSSYPLSVFARDDTLANAARRGALKILRILPQPDDKTNVEIEYVPVRQLRYRGVLTTDNRYLSIVLECHMVTPLEDGGTARQSERREMGALQKGHAVPECERIEEKSVAGDIDIVHTTSFSDYSYDAHPEEEFRLSHYGLPEPGEGSLWPTSVWFLIGAALAGLSLLFRALSRRNAVKESAP